MLSLNRLMQYTICGPFLFKRGSLFYLPKAVSRMWTKQNIVHEIGHKIKHWCWCKCQQNMPTEQCQFEKKIFHWKKCITIILLMYQSAMLYKYKQNITFNVINTQIHTKKKKSMKKQGAGHFSIGGGKFSIIVF